MYLFNFVLDKKYFYLIYFIFIRLTFFSQSFAPVPEEFGTTAIAKDSSIIKAWAKSINLNRGYINISDKSLGLSTFGTPEEALNQAEGNSFNVVSLGDSGVAVLEFEFPIFDGNGFDFVVFENAFADNILELAFVEVSSDGINFFRFPSVSEIPLVQQLTGFEYSDCRYINNLAGKYRQGFGTPFDLSDLNEFLNDSLIDLNNITHLKLIDVIGDISGNFSSFDKNGTIINDPFPTPFESSGFDLDGIGAINLKNVTFLSDLEKNNVQISPNPCVNLLNISLNNLKINKLEITNIVGIKQNIEWNSNLSINCSNFENGTYFLNINDNFWFQFIKIAE